MPFTQAREITAARRLDNVRYAIRDLACVADEVTKQGHKVLPLNVGDPLNFDFQTPPHIIEAVYKAMRDGKNGYAPSPGIPEAIEAIRGEAARKGITDCAGCIRNLRRKRDRRSLHLRAWSIPAKTFSRLAPITRSTRPCSASWASQSTPTI